MKRRDFILFASISAIILTFIVTPFVVPRLVQAAAAPAERGVQDMLEIKELALDDVASSWGEIVWIYVSCNSPFQAKSVYIFLPHVSDLRVFHIFLYPSQPSGFSDGVLLVPDYQLLSVEQTFHGRNLELLSISQVRPQPVPAPAGGILEIAMFSPISPEIASLVALVEAEQSAGCSMSVLESPIH